MIYTSSKLIELGSTAFRQPNADSHCKFVHGYQLKAEITFGCNELDKNNWVYDFGGLKELKTILNNQFDHTLVIDGNDPHKDLFVKLNEAGAVDLRIMDGGVGIEKFAEWCFKTADTYVDEATDSRVWVESVTVYEHDSNYASVNKLHTSDTTFQNEEGTKTYVSHEEFERVWKEWSEKQSSSSETTTQPTEEPEQQQHSTSNAAPVGGQQVSQNKGNWFEGTSWG